MIAHWFLMPIGRATKKILTKADHKKHKRSPQKAQTVRTHSCAFCGLRLCFCDLLLLAGLLQEFGDETGPARLMARADAGAIVAVEVFVEGY